ncbi:uncharacterized protein LOC103169246 isoform X2 [Ornithorhynchus anatinus]|uniref:uncharacterized protein LOC103169246 isoform X2 n=1 Tax=Ornithorhynchus anatinus TaxID=9258 RepID=UPI0010A9209B|nr:uncharacterized protein LOC103169246 isoform X2 [Ornithorhynchus anatinus]
MGDRRVPVSTRKCSVDTSALPLIIFVLSQLYGWGEARSLPPPDPPGPYHLSSGDVDWYNNRRRAKFLVPPSRLPLANTPTQDSESLPAAVKLTSTNDAIRFEFVKTPEVLEKKNLKPPSPQDTLKTNILACLVATGFLLIIVMVFQILIFCYINKPMRCHTSRICKGNQLNSDCESGAEKQMEANASSNMGDIPLKDSTPPASPTQSSVAYGEAQYSPCGTSSGETPATSPRPQSVYDSSPGSCISVLEPGDLGDQQGESGADKGRRVEDGDSPSWKTGQGISE